jgi:type II secretory pathway predicted ATPase ExeA
MSEAAAHLNKRAQAVLDLSVDERIAHIRRPRWIGYSRAKKVLSQLEDLLIHPKTHRMPSLLMIGETNAGKTMLANRFVQLHAACDNPDGEAAVVPVLLVQAPPGPDETHLYDSIFETLFAPYRPRDRVAQKQFQVLRLLKQVGLRMLIIDELHNILAGSVSRQRQFLNVLKYLSNDLKIALVGLGTQEALRAIQTDPQLANRFKPVPLPRWRMDREFLMLLASFEQTLPLRHPSGLIEKHLAQKLLAQSEGNLGELSILLTTAAIYAIETGIEQINDAVLAAIDWAPPSERRRQAERLV